MITFATIGLMFILKYGSILHSIRQFLCKDSRYFTEMFKCSLCLGAWSGLFVGFISEGHLSLLHFLYGASVSFFADNILDLIQSASMKLESEATKIDRENSKLS